MNPRIQKMSSTISRLSVLAAVFLLGCSNRGHVVSTPALSREQILDERDRRYVQAVKEYVVRTRGWSDVEYRLWVSEKRADTYLIIAYYLKDGEDSGHLGGGRTFGVLISTHTAEIVGEVGAQ